MLSNNALFFAFNEYFFNFAGDFNNFIKISDEFIKDSIEKINEGDFRIAPFKEKSQYSPCRFCQNKDICLFKDGDINETNS